MIPFARTCPRRALRVAALAIGVSLLAACSPRYYAPNTHHVPLLQRGGDLSVSLAAGEGRGELQGAYAVADRLSVMLNAAAFEPKEDEDGDGGRGGFAEVGVGYQRPLSARTHLEVYALVGGGDVENDFPSTLASNPGTTGTIEGRLARYGVQPAIGYRSGTVHVAVSARFLALRYSEVAGSLVFGGEDQVAYLRANDRHVLVEPALTLRAGPETVKLQLQVGRSFNLRHSDFRQDDGHVTLGIVYTPVR